QPLQPGSLERAEPGCGLLEEAETPGLAIASPLVRFLEDFRVGDAVELGPVTVTADEIVEFASRYDPQPFHVDPVAARQSPFGGLVASGWHTTALFMGMFVRAVLLDSASLGSP